MHSDDYEMQTLMRMRMAAQQKAEPSAKESGSTENVKESSGGSGSKRKREEEEQTEEGETVTANS